MRAGRFEAERQLFRVSMQAAEGPDQHEDRNRHAEQPQKQIASHGLASFGRAFELANAWSPAEFRSAARGNALVAVRR
jgi:hypothetical protein